MQDLYMDAAVLTVACCVVLFVLCELCTRQCDCVMDGGMRCSRRAGLMCTGTCQVCKVDSVYICGSAVHGTSNAACMRCFLREGLSTCATCDRLYRLTRGPCSCALE